MHLLMLLVTVCWASNIIAGKEALTGIRRIGAGAIARAGRGIIFTLCGFSPVAACAACNCRRGNGSFCWPWRRVGLP